MKARLEIDYLEIHRSRSRWNIYFIIAAEHPENPAETIITTLPTAPIKMRKMDQNRVDFEAEGSGETNGLMVLEREIPEDRSIRVRIWIVQSRENSRNVGGILSEIQGQLGNDKVVAVKDSLLKAIGTTTPWVGVAGSILGMSGIIGNFLKISKDRKMGFVNLDESFTEEEIQLGELDRMNRISSLGELGWTWVIQ